MYRQSRGGTFQGCCSGVLLRGVVQGVEIEARDAGTLQLT